MKTCKTCIYWKARQSVLSYSERHGFCTSPKLEYSVTTDSGTPRILDRGNLSEKYLRTHFLKSEKEQSDVNLPIDRYTLVTEQDFGCRNHEEE